MPQPAASELTIRIYEQTRDGAWHDREEDYSLADFAGCMPAVGDMILAPGVLDDLDRFDPKNRQLRTVVQRIFNARDLPDYVVLIVEEHVPEGRERKLVAL